MEKHIETNLFKSASFTLKEIPYVQIKKNKDYNMHNERIYYVEEGNKSQKK